LGEVPEIAASILSPGVALTDLFARARAEVDRVADDPEGRYQLRRAFYDKLTAPQPGSRWWRDVNLDFLYDAQCAAVLHDQGDVDPVDPSLPAPVAYWLAYLRGPSASSWYRAHNASIASGYLRHADSARAEIAAEQVFLNMVLYRLLYAQSMVQEDAPGLLGWLARTLRRWKLRGLERLMADPRSPSVDVIVHLPDFYPRHYPLQPADIRDVLERGDSLGVLAEKVLDDGFILPALTRLYALAAGWLKMPEISCLVANHKPVYPNITLTPY